MLQHYLWKQKAENYLFSLKCWMLFCQQTHKTHSYYHLVTAEPHFICTRIGRMHQTKPRKEYIMLLSVTTHSSFGKSVLMSVAVWKVFFVEPEVKSQWTVFVVYHTISTNVSCCQAHCRQHFICLSVAQLMHAPTHDVCNTVQQLLCKTLSFISPELWPQEARTELCWLQDSGSLQQCEYEFQVNKTEEIWKSSNTTSEWKDANFRVSVFCQVVQKHYLGEVEKS